MGGEDVRAKFARLKELAAEIAATLESEVQEAIATSGEEPVSENNEFDTGTTVCEKYNCPPPFSCSDFGCASRFTLE